MIYLNCYIMKTDRENIIKKLGDVGAKIELIDI